MNTTTTTGAITRRAWIVYVAVCLIFGTTFLAIKIGSNAGIPPFLAAGIRFTTAGTLLVALRGGLFDRDTRPDLSFLWRVALLGVLIIGVTFAATYWASGQIASGLVAQIQAVAPIVVAVLSTVLLRTRLRTEHVIGLAVGFGGSLFLIGAARGEGAAALAGAIAAFAAELSFGLGTIWYRHAFGDRHDSFKINGYSMLFGGVFLLLVALLTGQTTLPRSPEAIGSLVYLIVFGSIGAHSMYLWLIANTSPLFASTWLFISPVIATLVGVVVLGEQVGLGNVAGALAVLGGVYLVQRGERR